MHGPRDGGRGGLVGELEAAVDVLRVDPLDEGALLPAQCRSMSRMLLTHFSVFKWWLFQSWKIFC